MIFSCQSSVHIHVKYSYRGSGKNPSRLVRGLLLTEHAIQGFLLLLLTVAKISVRETHTCSGASLSQADRSSMSSYHFITESLRHLGAMWNGSVVWTG